MADCRLPACHLRGTISQKPCPQKTCRSRTCMMNNLRQYAWAGAVSLVLAATLAVSAAAQKADKDAKDNPDNRRPKVTLKAQPVIAMAPARVVLTAELNGGANDFEEFYCPTVE